MSEALVVRLAELEDEIENRLTQGVDTLKVVSAAVTEPGGHEIARIQTGSGELRRAGHDTQARLVTLVARHAPVASDLRLLLALIQITDYQGLIANQFDLISEQLVQVRTAGIDRYATTPKVASMATLAGEQIRLALAAFAARDRALAEHVDRHDDTLDALNRDVFSAALDANVPPDHRELALRYILIARSLERIGDNAVDIAEQVAFLLTAEPHELSDASRPKPQRPLA